jgi:hypothetical protein
MSRDSLLKKNQEALRKRRREKRMAEAKKKREASKPKRNGFGERTPLSGGAGGHTTSAPGGTPKPKPKPTSTPTPTPKPKPKPTPSSSSSSSSSSSMPSNPKLKTPPGGSGTSGRPMPSNPAVGYSKPVRKNFKTQKAFLAALEVYMRRKNRGTAAADSVKPKAKKATDGRQYGM